MSSHYPTIKSLSVVVPIFNEEQNIPSLLGRLNEVLDQMSVQSEIIAVDDGSRDRSRELLADAAARSNSRLRLVVLNRNYGQHAAIMAGFSVMAGVAAVTIDADLQNPPEEIPRLISKLDEGYEVVGSIRRDRQDPFLRKFASSIVNAFARKATGVAMRDYGCMLRAYRRNIVNAMTKCHEHSTFIPMLANTFSSKVTEIEVSHSARQAGASKYDLWKLINLQFDLVTGISTFPLRVLSIVGSVLSLFGMVLGITLISLRLMYGNEWGVDGVFTLFAAMFFLVGAQFMGMGLLGEYLGRIYHDVRDRPKFIIERVYGEHPKEFSDSEYADESLSVQNIN